LRTNPACFPEVHIKEPDIYSDRLLKAIPKNCDKQASRRQDSNQKPGVLSSWNSSGSPRLASDITMILPEPLCRWLSNLSEESSLAGGDGLIFYDELYSFSKNLTKDSQHSENSPKPFSYRLESFCSLRSLRLARRERLAFPFIFKPTCQRTP